MTKEERRLDLNNKLLRMGQALAKEGVDTNDGCILTAGSVLILISNLMTSEKDMFLFGELGSMFSAKMILEDMERKNPKIVGDEFMAEILSKINSQNPEVPKPEEPKIEEPKRKSKRRKGNNGDSETES